MATEPTIPGDPLTRRPTGEEAIIGLEALYYTGVLCRKMGLTITIGVHDLPRAAFDQVFDHEDGIHEGELIADDPQHPMWWKQAAPFINAYSREAPRPEEPEEETDEELDQETEDTEHGEPGEPMENRTRPDPPPDSLPDEAEPLELTGFHKEKFEKVRGCPACPGMLQASSEVHTEQGIEYEYRCTECDAQVMQTFREHHTTFRPGECPEPKPRIVRRGARQTGRGHRYK